MRRGLGSGVFFIFGGKYLNYTLNPGNRRGFLFCTKLHQKCITSALARLRNLR